MLRFFTPRRLAILALAALALPFALAGCGDSVRSVDPSITYPGFEGTYHPDARLYAWPDIPTEVYEYADLGTPGPSEADTLLRVEQVYRTGPGAVQTMLLDGSAASGFEFFHAASNGGLQPMRDYVVNSPRKWLDSHWELYELTDSSPTGYAPSTYVARGLLAGTSTSASPLSNAAQLTASTTKSLVYTGSLFPQRADSNFTMSWLPVTGAVGYWIHVYQFRSDALGQEYIESGTPRPIWNGKVRDQFVGYVAAPATEYKLGTAGAQVVTYKPPIAGQVYVVRVTAIDGNGQVIACPGTDFSRLTVSADGSILNVTGASFSIIQFEGGWRIFSLGASLVNPGGTPSAPNLSRLPAGTSALAPALFPGTHGRR